MIDDHDPHAIHHFDQTQGHSPDTPGEVQAWRDMAEREAYELLFPNQHDRGPRAEAEVTPEV